MDTIHRRPECGTNASAPTVAVAQPGGALYRARSQFLDSLAGRLMRVVDGLERWRRMATTVPGDTDLLDVQRELHTLCGTAGTLGFVELTAAAASLHDMLGHTLGEPGAASADSIDAAVDGLLGSVITASLGPADTRPLPAPRAAPAKVLLVDDDTDLLAITRAQLDIAGYATSPFDNSELALGALAALAPDVVVVDWNMPGLDGAALLTRLRERPECRALPVIVFSSCDSDAERALMRSVGADDTVSKAANPSVLLAAVERQLQRVATDTGTQQSAPPAP